MTTKINKRGREQWRTSVRVNINLVSYLRNNILFLQTKRVQPEAGDNAKLAKMLRGHGELSVGT